MTEQAYSSPPSESGSGLEALARFIEENQAEICRQWVTAVDRSPQVPASESLTFRQVLDHFPTLCRQLAEALRHSVSAPPAAGAEAAAAAHARTRWQQGYELDELIREISIIRREFSGRWFDLFASTSQGRLEDSEARRARAIVHQFFDELILTSVTQFVEEEQLRREAAQGELRLAEEKAAAAAGRAQIEIVSLLGHELRTPLTPVLLAASALVQEESLSPELREFAALVEHNTHIEAGLIDDLLEAARLNRTPISLKLETVNLHDCLASARAACAPDFASQQITPVVQLSASEFHVHGDKRRLNRLFVTLLRHAIQVTPPGGDIAITSRNIGEDIEITVADSGSALDEEALRKLFLPFEEGRRPSPFGMGGFGASRYVARAVVEAHGGEITAGPRDLPGAVLTVRLKWTAHGIA
jgi:signal transduction histidine kinase